jgi:2-dehydro-3-deoxygluconokinase
MLDWDAILAGAGWFHATGITAALGSGPVETLTAAIGTARAHGVPTSLDLNWRPGLWRDRDPVPIVAPLARGVDLVIGNPHSLRAMLGLAVPDRALATPEGAGDVARAVARELGCRRVALTHREILGANTNRWSAMLFDRDTDVLLTSRPWTVTVVDRIGGGDAFAAGLIAALLQGRAPYDALEFAVTASALKLRVPGDFNRVNAADVVKVLRGMAAAGALAGELSG